MRRAKAVIARLETRITSGVSERESDSPRPAHVFTALQREIWDALYEKAMTADELEDALSVARSTLVGGDSGGLNELQKKDLVKNCRKVRGYYRADAPPKPKT